jgi:DNA modification methylase
VTARVLVGDCLEKLRGLPADTAQTCVTSPPYWGLRDYGVAGQLGLEKTPEEYVARLVEVFREVRRVLKKDGTLWLNLGDSYAGSAMTGGNNGFNTQGGPNGSKQARQFQWPNSVPSGLKPKDMVGIPWRVAFALQADGWLLRSDIIWHKPNPMPESVRDRPTKAHEYLFLLAKGPRYFYDAKAVAEECAESTRRDRRTGTPRIADYAQASATLGQGTSGSRRQARNSVGDGITRNRRTVWTIAPKPFKEAHFATMPTGLVEPCVLAGSRPGDTVLDCFSGAGTTGLVALQHGRQYLGIELNPEYVAMSRRRMKDAA